MIGKLVQNNFKKNVRVDLFYIPRNGFSLLGADHWPQDTAIVAKLCKEFPKTDNGKRILKI